MPASPLEKGTLRRGNRDGGRRLPGGRPLAPPLSRSLESALQVILHLGAAKKESCIWLAPLLCSCFRKIRSKTKVESMRWVSLLLNSAVKPPSANRKVTNPHGFAPKIEKNAETDMGTHSPGCPKIPYRVAGPAKPTSARTAESCPRFFWKVSLLYFAHCTVAGAKVCTS